MQSFSIDAWTHVLQYLRATPKEYARYCLVCKSMLQAIKQQQYRILYDFECTLAQYAKIPNSACISTVKIIANTKQQIAANLHKDLQRLLIIGDIFQHLQNVPLIQNLRILNIHKFANVALQNVQWDKYDKLEQVQVCESELVRIDASFLQLINLTSLDLSHNRLSSIDELQAMVHLRELNIAFNKISSISIPVTRMKKLTWLNAQGNKLVNVDCLCELAESLTWLNVAKNALTSISTLSVLYNLQYLDVSDNAQMYDAQFLQHMTKLWSFKSENTGIAELEICKTMPFLRFLNLSNMNSSSSLEILHYLPDIREITIRKYNDTNIAALQYCTKLESVTFEENSFPDASVLSMLPNLHTVLVAKNGISTITCTGPCFQKVTRMDLNHNGIGNISFLQYATQMVELSIAHCNLTDITSLSCMTQLRILHMSNNQISDIAVVQHMSLLQELQAGHNSITSIAPCFKLHQLRSLSLPKNDIPALQIASIAYSMVHLSKMFIDRKYSEQVDLPSFVHFTLI